MEKERPIGYWLKHLHNLLEDQLETTLADHSVSRRHWQVLNSLAREPHDEAALRTALAPFWEEGAPTLEASLGELTGRGWITQTRGGGPFALTEQGRAVHGALTRQVQRTRAQVLTGVSPDQYTDVVRTLAAMARNVEQALTEGRPEPV
ncbi:DNA-binding transcriptional regulator, MarR family [Streptomyces zhaozhouensis]|uniref:DNA-binding transcriptional regulator, MarR family n=1 Tax=Streptomyces zhaozhouensis TaxID=1300267 RepID=A0A286DUI1_9ACTN|nr:MarR family winged helix-turn-helix transcriptional regulator [Streptomyces zhaozhouensis]SOD62322.1 DNA-binding transcriptional regulator, MarR family [Streptomyces zhaozhouensis]